MRQLYSAEGISPRGAQLWVASRLRHGCIQHRPTRGLSLPPQTTCFCQKTTVVVSFLVCVFSWANYQEDSYWDKLKLQLLELTTGTHLVFTVFFLYYPFLDSSYPLLTPLCILVAHPHPMGCKPPVSVCFPGCNCSPSSFSNKLYRKELRNIPITSWVPKALFSAHCVRPALSPKDQGQLITLSGIMIHFLLCWCLGNQSPKELGGSHS